jgi:hypothetical protein
MSSDMNEEFEPLVVIEFALSTPMTTKQWICTRLTDNERDDQGAGFLARFEKDPDHGVRLSCAQVTLPFVCQCQLVVCVCIE